MVNEQDMLKLQARKAYEVARLRSALKFLLWVSPILLLSATTCTSELAALVLGLGLASAAVYYSWRGLEFEKALRPGLWIGSLALSIPLVAHVLGICCKSNLETAFCIGSGVLGGILLAVQMRRSGRADWKVTGLAALFAGLASATGCDSGCRRRNVAFSFVVDCVWPLAPSKQQLILQFTSHAFKPAA